MARIKDLVPGQQVTINFKGSKTIGNEPYEGIGTFIRADDESAEFNMGGQTVEFYKMPPSRLWRYGTSAEIATFTV